MSDILIEAKIKPILELVMSRKVIEDDKFKKLESLDIDELVKLVLSTNVDFYNYIVIPLISLLDLGSDNSRIDGPNIKWDTQSLYKLRHDSLVFLYLLFK